MRFKDFLISEQHEYLADKVGDILTSVQELVEAKAQMAARHLIKNSENIVTQIRKVLHSAWLPSERKYLRVLQKCGVAIMKAIDEKGNLKEILSSVKSELEKLSEKIGEPINKLGAPQKNQTQEGQPPGSENI